MYVVQHSYEFAAYREKSLAFYTILLSYADELQAVSIDEALINVSMAVAELGRAPPQFGEGGDADGDEQDSAKQLAENIRADVREATGCESKCEPVQSWRVDNLTPCALDSQYRHWHQHPPREISHSPCKTCRRVPPQARRHLRMYRATHHQRAAWIRLRRRGKDRKAVRNLQLRRASQDRERATPGLPREGQWSDLIQLHSRNRC